MPAKQLSTRDAYMTSKQARKSRKRNKKTPSLSLSSEPIWLNIQESEEDIFNDDPIDISESRGESTAIDQDHSTEIDSEIPLRQSQRQRKLNSRL